MDPAPPAWTLAWLSGEVSRQQGFLKEAADSFGSVLEDNTPERRRRKFDFSLDFRVRNSLGLTLIDLAEQAATRGRDFEAQQYFAEAEQQFLGSLRVDSEDVTAHANLAAIYLRTGKAEKAQHHRELQLKYKMDDNAADLAIPTARRQYPAANHAAESLVIYSLQRNE